MEADVGPEGDEDEPEDDAVVADPLEPPRPGGVPAGGPAGVEPPERRGVAPGAGSPRH